MTQSQPWGGDVDAPGAEKPPGCPLCLALPLPSITPLLSGRATSGQGAPLSPPVSRRRVGVQPGAERGRGLGAPSADPAARGPLGTRRPGWRASAGRRGVWPRGCGAARATHVLRVPLVHRGQWRPGRHFVRAAGSGRGPPGRAECGLRGRRRRAQARAEAGRSAPAGRGRCNQRPGAERSGAGKRPRGAGRGGGAARGGAGDAGAGEGGLRAGGCGAAGRGAGGGVRAPLGSRGHGRR